MNGPNQDASRPAEPGAAKANGLSISDLIGLPDQQRRLLNWMLRAGDVTLRQAADELALSVDSVAELLAELESKGYVQELVDPTPVHYRTVRAQRPTRPRLRSNLWRALES